MLPYDCGLTRPTVERYTDHQFRRVSRWFYARDLDEADGVPLVAIVDLLGERAARYAFHWTSPKIKRQLREAKKRFWDQSQFAIVENHKAMTVDNGVALLRAMKDGGYENGTLPEAVALAVVGLRERGYTLADIAEHTGLTVSQVSWLFRQPVDRTGRASAAAGLGFAG